MAISRVTQFQGLSSNMGRHGIFRRAARKVLANPWLLEQAASRSAGHAAVFVMHEFTDSHDDALGLPVEQLAHHLGWLRLHRYRLVALGELIDDLREGRPIPPRTVAFTVDDGYASFADLAAPVFSQYDCPVTVFLITDFIDKKSWLWWDVVTFAFLTTTRSDCRLAVDGATAMMTWGNSASRRAAAERANELIKWLSAADRTPVIRALVEDLDVQLPEHAAGEFAPMSWDQARSLSRDSVTFGPHTVTHPILSMEASAIAAREIEDSWNRLRVEIPNALPVFCYPNGDPRAFSQRDIHVVSALGLTASVSNTPGYVSSKHFATATDLATRPLPRLQLESAFERFAQVASGLDRLKQSLRW